MDAARPARAGPSCATGRACWCYGRGVGRLAARCRFFLFFGHFLWPAPAADGAIAHTVATAHSVSGHTPKRLPSHVVPTAYGTSPQKGHPADRTHDDPSHRHREGRHVVDGAHDVLQKSSTRGRMPGYFSPITWPGLRNRGGSAERVGSRLGLPISGLSG